MTSFREGTTVLNLVISRSGDVLIDLVIW